MIRIFHHISFGSRPLICVLTCSLSVSVFRHTQRNRRNRSKTNKPAVREHHAAMCRAWHLSFPVVVYVLFVLCVPFGCFSPLSGHILCLLLCGQLDKSATSFVPTHHTTLRGHTHTPIHNTEYTHITQATEAHTHT